MGTLVGILTYSRFDCELPKRPQALPKLPRTLPKLRQTLLRSPQTLWKRPQTLPKRPQLQPQWDFKFFVVASLWIVSLWVVSFCIVSLLRCELWVRVATASRPPKAPKPQKPTGAAYVAW